MKRILIDGLPRTGTTTLARLFAIHPQTRVIIEPFHPRRYEGRHHQAVISAADTNQVFEFAWNQWNIIKHVWEAGVGWPFTRRPELQQRLWQSADLVIEVNRCNLAKRYLSAELSRTLRFWIGTRQDFVDRLRNVCLLPIDIEKAKEAIQRDREALADRTAFLKRENICTAGFLFEEFFGASTDQQFDQINTLFSTCGIPPLPQKYLRTHASRWLNPEVYQWSSEEVYQSIPNLAEFEAAFASE
ncbi:MAG: hypothetical protein ABSE51_11090 [Terracidiphilus sp.]|jgi:hypothetical protein